MGILLFIVIVVVPTWLLIARDRRYYRSRPKNQQHKEAPQIIEEDQARIHEYHHREDEKKFWKRSICWSIITLVIAVSALVVAWLTFDDAHDALVAVQRAFVYPDTGRIDFLPMINDDNNLLWGVAPIWENSGNTPVADLKVGTFCAAVKPDRKDVESGVIITNRYETRVLGPKQKITGETCSIPKEYLQDVIDGKLRFVFIYFATYRDVFGKPHRTEGCRIAVHIHGNVTDFNQLIPMPYEFCGTHNCADDQCRD